MKQIIADPHKCLACRTCEVACALAHAETNDLVAAVVQGGAQPRIYIEAAGGLAVPLQCRHCEDAPCIQVCPASAIARCSPDAPVVADPQKCIGCEFCVQVCPFGVIRMGHDRKVVIKCDLCVKRLEEGLSPACVASCPVHALVFEEVQADTRRRRGQTALNLLRSEVS